MALVLAQFLTGLASASALFLVAAGLSLVFGVTRVVNFAHGSFYLLGAYLGYTLINALGGGAWGFWLAVALTALVVGLVGVVMEVVVLRPIYRSPELFPLLATFGVVLVIQDTALWIWGPQDLLGPRAPGFTGTVTLLGQPIPQYDLLLIILAPLVLLALWLALHRTRWGILLRATTQDREMVAALGVNGRLLMTSALFVGAALAGLGGAIQLPKGDANLGMDLNIIVEAFVVTVVGGMGSLGGAYLAALLISSIKVFAVANAQYSVLGIAVWQLELVLVFIVMAVVLVLRPQGLLGRAAVLQEIQGGHAHPPLAPGGGGLWVTLALGVGAALAPLGLGNYGVILATEVLILALFAASLQFLMGLGGIISFGHAAYFGLGAYAAALAIHHGQWSMGAALALAPVGGALGALFFGWFCVRLTGVYLAMLTLAFAQITWSVAFQWISVTGGDNGLLGIWPPRWAAEPVHFYYLTLAVVVVGVGLLRRVAFSPFGYALRAARDAPGLAGAVGIDVKRQRWLAFGLAGGFAGVSGGLFAFLKGSVSPATMDIPVSVDALVMVLLGGVNALVGPLVGSGLFVVLKAELVSLTDHWRLILGATIIVLVIAFPQGLAGAATRLNRHFGRRPGAQ